MKIVVVNDLKGKHIRSVSEAVAYAAFEKNIDCEPIDISDLVIDPLKAGTPQYIRKTAEHLKKENAGAVICTGIWGMKLVNAVKKELDGIICCGLISEYSYPMMTDRINMDFYFAAHQDIKNMLVKKGIPEKKIYVTGIPVRKNYREHLGKAAARNYLVIPGNKRVYLLISDGLELEVIEELCSELDKTEKNDYVMYIPTERNGAIRDELINYAEGNSHIQIITYTKKLNLYVESADALLLKPDAVISTQAAVTGVPIVHLALGNRCVTPDSDFFASHEMAVVGNNIKDTINKARRFVEEKAVAARMIQMQYRNVCSDAADKIIDIILNTKKQLVSG